MDSKLDSIKSHEKGKAHEKLAKQAAVEQRSKNRGLSFFGFDAVEQQRTNQVVILHAQFDKPVVRQDLTNRRWATEDAGATEPDR